MEIVVLLGVFWVIPWFLGNAMGKAKGRAGFLYGFFLGWVGIICLALLPPLNRRPS